MNAVSAELALLILADAVDELTPEQMAELGWPELATSAFTKRGNWFWSIATNDGQIGAVDKSDVQRKATRIIVELLRFGRVEERA